MINWEEGFRRIGVAVLWLGPVGGLTIGVVVALMTGLWNGILAAGYTILAWCIFLHIVNYVIRGFLEEDKKKK